MGDIPTTTDISLKDQNGDALYTSASVKEVLETKYNDASSWANYAAHILESKLGSVNAAAEDFDISNFLDEAVSAMNAIPSVTAGSITYSAPDAPTYDTVPSYTAPSDPSLDTISYSAPAAPTLDTAVYAAPTLGTLKTLPDLNTYSAGTAPSTTVDFTNSSFTDTLLTALRTRLENDIATSNTGLGDAEAALFARETARQNAARALAYDEITTQFSSRGFDMPTGALLAKQTEVNNESAIKLSDSSSQIMAESARLAVDYNKSVISSSTQLLDLISKVFDSKIVRDFEAAKTSVEMALEEFKANIQVLVANADLEAKHLGAISAYNDSIVKSYVGEIDGEAKRINAITEINKSKLSVESEEIKAESARINALAVTNKSKSDTYASQVQANISKVSSVTESNKAISSAYAAAVSSAAADVQAQGEVERAKASAGDINSKKALGLASIAKEAAISNIDAATRKYLGEINVLQMAAQGSMQLVASALNSVSVSSTLGFSGSSTSVESTSENTTTTDVFGGESTGDRTYEHTAANSI